MKRIITTLMGILLIGLILHAQEAPPQAFSLKATIKDNLGLPVQLKKVGLRISIMQGDMNGLAVYSEYFNPITNLYSQVDIEIGQGAVLSGSFSSIDWSADAYYLKIEADVNGGNNYELLSVTQLLSVPYALFAGQVLNNKDNDADTDPTNELQVLSIGHDTIYLSDGGFVKLPNTTSADGQFYYLDKDGDGYGDRFEPVWVPAGVPEPDDFTADIGDCNDENEDINPSAIEINGDGIDNNCNGLIDEQDSDIDNDGDGIADSEDNCPLLSNPDQTDTDGDGIGDVCELVMPGQPVTDIDGNSYKTLIVGAQTWMASNLGTITLNDGVFIPEVSMYEWIDVYTPAFTSYSLTNAKYYSMEAVETGKLCPSGWHVPTVDDWTELANYLGGFEIAGERLHNIGFTEFGGYINHKEIFDLYKKGYWHSNTHIIGSVCSEGSGFDTKPLNIGYQYQFQGGGFTVRCLKTDPNKDYDNDGFNIIEGDCDDFDASTFPGASETCGDGIDQDCNGYDLPCK